MRLTAQAASSVSVSTICAASTAVLGSVLIARKTSGDSSAGVSRLIFASIYDSFTTQTPGALALRESFQELIEWPVVLCGWLLFQRAKIAATELLLGRRKLWQFRFIRTIFLGTILRRFLGHCVELWV